MQLLWKTVWQVFKKLKIELPYDLAIPLLGIYPKELKARTDICTVFLTALFTIAKRQKQLKCPSVDEWINKMGQNTIEQCSTFIREETLTKAIIWVNLEDTVLSEISQCQKKQILCEITHMRDIEESYSQTESKMAAVRGFPARRGK